MKRTGLGRNVIAAAVCITLAGPVLGEYSANNDPGSLGDDKIYNRVITVRPGARWINVNGDEAIKFVDAGTGKSFVWVFDSQADTIQLSRIAPAGMFAGTNAVIYRAPSVRELHRMRGRSS